MNLIDEMSDIRHYRFPSNKSRVRLRTMDNHYNRCSTVEYAEVKIITRHLNSLYTYYYYYILVCILIFYHLFQQINH